MTLSPEIGLLALTIAFMLSFMQFTLPLFLKNAPNTALKITSSLSIAAFIFTAFSFLILINAFYVSDFSVALAHNHSHQTQALIYKITSVWGNHEGSMLLFVLILTLFSALIALNTAIPSALKTTTQMMQGVMSFAFIGFVIFTSNPFARLSPAPLEGKDLNPILQDLGLAIHPPLLYIGYVGFSLTFSFAAAALINGTIDKDWAKATRPYVILAWIFLTLGIAMGSYWAYYELGWGGWWFWDPVENASLMPWLFGTALLHSIIVMEKREALKIWCILLAILTFSFSLLGTFLVRSGILTSVHSFASDPTRGLVILVLLGFFIGGALLLFALRVSHLKEGASFHPLSREGAIVVNNLFLTVSSSAILFGTLYPLILEAVSDEKISVGAPYFNLVFTPLIAPLLLLIPLSNFLAWKKGNVERIKTALFIPFLLIPLAMLFAFNDKFKLMPSLLFGVAAYIIIGSLKSLPRLKAPLSTYAMLIAHIGVGVMLIGITGESYLQKERIEPMKLYQSITLGDKELVFIGLKSDKQHNYEELSAVIDVREGGRTLYYMQPAKRFYATRQMQTTEAAIETWFVSQVYLSLAEIKNGEIILRAYEKPLVLLIWLGACLMAFGGLLGLIGRRK